jgi:hypothetical protein
MRKLLVAASLLLAVAVRAVAGAPPSNPIDIDPTASGNFSAGTINAFWTVQNVHSENTEGLQLGQTAQPTSFLGMVTHQYAAGSEPDPDAIAEAQIDLGDGWTARSVTVRIQRDNDPDQIVYARVTAWKEKRDATVTKVRLSLGARIKTGGSYVWERQDFPAPGDTDLDDVVTGKLKLVLDEKTVTVSYPGDSNPLTRSDLDKKGTVISGVRIEMQGDSSVLEPQPAVETLSAQPPP